MVSAAIIAAVTAVSGAGAGETVLIDFGATWCGPCRQMSPVVDQLAHEGFPVRKVDIDQNRAAAQRYGVSGIPCFIMLRNGQVVDRVVGATSYGRLRQMLAKAQVRPPGENIVEHRGQSPDRSTRKRLLSGRRNASPRPVAKSQPASYNSAPPRFNAAPAPSFNNTATAAPSFNPAPASSAQSERLLRASVRLKIDEGNSYSYGSGTIIDARDGAALVLTCGHLFRESAGKCRITVEVFEGDGPVRYEGQLIRYDDRRDVGLVSFRSRRPVTTARLAAAEFDVNRGANVISIGCDHGARPTVQVGRVLAKNSFVGPPNVKVSGEPVQGRSGGGLFTSDGRLIGVCNFADPTDKAGAYAALSTIYEILSQAGLRDVAATPTTAIAATTTLPEKPMRRWSEVTRTVPRPKVAAAATNRNAVEVVCVVRNSGQADRPSEVIVLESPSAKFLGQLASERRAQAERHQTSLAVPAARRASSWEPQWRTPDVP